MRVLAGQGGGALRGPARGDLASLMPGDTNLPGELSSFVGREAEASGIRERLSSAAIVTITGGAGIGKTRLALHLARRLAPSYADGAWLVELASVARSDDPSLVAEAVAAVFDVRPEPGRPITDSVVARLRHSSLMLVLDNCEHVVGATAALARALLEACPRLDVLATSQVPLGVAGEQAWPLGPLSLPGPGRAGAASDAVALFIARARLLNANFVVTPERAQAIEEICRRLDGIPLAIELAAARTAVLSPAEIAEHLGERFKLLTRLAPAATPRHQTLQSAIDWSWELLSPPEQALLRRLSVFAGGARLAEVRAVCIGGEVTRQAVLDLLGALVSKSLVVADTTRSHTRYRLLETVRAYGRDRLEEAGEAGAICEVHATWYLEVAEYAWHQQVAAGKAEAGEALHDEHDNLGVALNWFLGDGDGQSALRMGFALTPFWKARGKFREGRESLERALAVGADAPPELRARATWGVGLLSLMQGDMERATSSLEESLALARRHGHERLAVEAFHLLAFVWVFTKDPQTALPLLQESVEWARARVDNRSLATALSLCGRAHLLSGEFAEAWAVFEECRELGRVVGQGGETKGLVGMGWVALSRGQHEEAARVLEEVLPSLRRDDDRFETALVLSFLGELAWLQADHAKARIRLEEGVALAGAMSAPFPLARCLTGLGRVSYVGGDFERALELVGDAVEAARRAQFPHAVVRCLVACAEVHRATGDLGGARARLDEALAIATEKGDRGGKALALRPLAILARLDGDYQGSTLLYLRALDLHVKDGVVGGVADTLENLAGLAVLEERAEHGARLLGAAHQLRRSQGSMRSPMDRRDFDVDTALARAALEGGKFEPAFRQGAAMPLDEAVALAGRRRGARKRPASGWASLTPAERQVVDLVAEGLTNREVARRMFVSPRTVQSHLTKAFRKVGLNSRSQLREAVKRQQ